MKFKLNTVTEDGDISKQLSGRIIFSLGDNFGDPLWWYDDEDRTSKQRIGIDFHCGPETKDGYLEDTYDCGMYAQLEEFFKSLGLKASIGAAENFHEFVVPEDMDPEGVWSIVKEELIKAGAVEKHF